MTHRVTSVGGRAYPGRDIAVTFDSARCLHAAECVRGLPEVFDANDRPWIRPDAAPSAAVADVIRRCPSGALQYELTNGPAEVGPEPTVVRRSSAGRVHIAGRLVIEDRGRALSETRAILCGCGSSSNQPYCDASASCQHETLTEH